MKPFNPRPVIIGLFIFVVLQYVWTVWTTADFNAQLGARTEAHNARLWAQTEAHNARMWQQTESFNAQLWAQVAEFQKGQ